MVTDQNVRQKFETAWNANLSDKVGITIPEMMDRLIDGSVKGMFIFGENPALSDPDTHHVVHALKSAEFLVVQDIFLTETAKLRSRGAAWSFLGREGGDLQQHGEEDAAGAQGRGATAEGPCRTGKYFANSAPDWDFPWTTPRRKRYFPKWRVFHRCSQDITYERLESGGIQWPCPSSDHPGTQFLHQGKIHTRPRAFPCHRLPSSGGNA